MIGHQLKGVTSTLVTDTSSLTINMFTTIAKYNSVNNVTCCDNFDGPCLPLNYDDFQFLILSRSMVHFFLQNKRYDVIPRFGLPVNQTRNATDDRTFH